jgi:predicted Zn-dependent protease
MIWEPEAQAGYHTCMPSRQSPPLRLRRAVAAALIPLLLAAPFAPVFAQPAGLPDLGEMSAQDLSPLLEQRLGRAIMVESRRDPAYIDDLDLRAYLNRIAQKLAAHAAGGGIDIEVFPVRDGSVNAFAMPGGFIGVNAGLVTTTRTESELAGVIAHEIGHVVQRHIARGLSAQKDSMVIMLASLLAALAASQAGGQGPEAALVIGQAMAADSQLTFSRAAEREADRTGFEMLRGAGFDPAGMVSFFGRMAQMSSLNEGTGQVFARSHPLSLERMSDMQNRARELSASHYADSVDYLYVRAKLRVLQADGVNALLDAIRALGYQGEENKGTTRSAAFYGVSVGWVLRKDAAQAQAAYVKATAGGVEHPMLARLAVDIALLENRPEDAVKLAQAAHARWPDQHSLGLAVAESLQRANRHEEAIVELNKLATAWSDEPRIYQMLADSHAKLRHLIPEKRNLAEYYRRVGALPAAVQVLQQARIASKDFYEQSSIDAALADVKREADDERELLQQFRKN